VTPQYNWTIKSIETGDAESAIAASGVPPVTTARLRPPSPSAPNGTNLCQEVLCRGIVHSAVTQTNSIRLSSPSSCSGTSTWCGRGSRIRFVRRSLPSGHSRPATGITKCRIGRKPVKKPVLLTISDLIVESGLPFTLRPQELSTQSRRVVRRAISEVLRSWLSPWTTGTHRWHVGTPLRPRLRDSPQTHTSRQRVRKSETRTKRSSTTACAARSALRKYRCVVAACDA